MRDRAFRRYTKDKIFKYRLLRIIRRGGYYTHDSIRSLLNGNYYYKFKKQHEFAYRGWWSKKSKNDRSKLKAELYKELNYVELF